MIDLSKFTFMDFGASQGGSLNWASGAFGGRGIGVDIDPKKIERLREKGFDGFVSDATRLDLPPDSVRYATMINFLEHLPGTDVGSQIIRSAIHVASDFVFILGPDFEALPELKEQGFKKYYADWSGHTWHHTMGELAKIVAPFKLPYVLLQTDPIRDSFHETILPLNASRNRGPYDPAIDPPKAFKKFSRGVFGTLVCIIAKKDARLIQDVLLRGLGLRLHAGRELFPPLYKAS